MNSKIFKNNLCDAFLHSAIKLNINNDLAIKLLSIRKPSIILKVPLEFVSRFVPNRMLKHIFDPLEIRKPNNPRFVWSGDWDEHALKIDKYYAEYSPAYRSIFQIFLEGYHYRDCDEYRMKADLIRQGFGTARGNSLSELDSYFEELISLKKKIESEGYKSQSEIKKIKKPDEIGVFVNRYGNLLKAEDNFSGTHRFGIAKLLNLPEVYVNIVAVHQYWARLHFNKLVTERNSLTKYLKL